MNRIVVALLTIAVSGGFAPILRRQVRAGEVAIPMTGTLPIMIRRVEHPIGFWASVAGQAAFCLTLVVAGLAMGVQALMA